MLSPSGMMVTFLPFMSGVFESAGSSGYSVSGLLQPATASFAWAMPAALSSAVPVLPWSALLWAQAPSKPTIASAATNAAPLRTVLR